MCPFKRLQRLSVVLVLPLVGLTAGCAPGPFAEQLPGSLGLPEAAPARPTVQYQYPAVHDMPPQRQYAPLDDAERERIEDELIRARDRQAGSAKDEASENKPSGTNR